MIRLNLLLIVAVLASAIYLVSVQYESRRLFAELDKAQNEARRLTIEFERLQVQKRAQATPARVQHLAKEKLRMQQATPGITMYVAYTDATRDGIASTTHVKPTATRGSAP